jgi:hypothetical protein
MAHDIRRWPVKYVGLLCNCSQGGNPKEELSPSLINRAFLLDRSLAPDGIAIFLYSPGDVTTPAGVAGYTINGDELTPARLPVPRINANWTYGTRRLLNQGIGYNGFKRWVAANGIRVYVPYAFAEIVSNKRKAYDAVRTYDPALHPYTENYSGSIVQVESFLERSASVFIKPRSGNRGNRIFVMRPDGGGVSLTYYDQRDKQVFGPLALEDAIGVIAGAVGGMSYVIQEGIESLRSEGSVFDVRVVMVNDGSRWHSIFETRLAPPGSDLSNVFQGGSIHVTETLLSRVLGDGVAAERLREIAHVGHGLARHLESRFPGQLMEIGFDFLLDQRRRLHLVEVNSKPGVAGFGSETRLFDWTPADEEHYRRWVQPHVTHIASFLRAKVGSAALNGT